MIEKIGKAVPVILGFFSLVTSILDYFEKIPLSIRSNPIFKTVLVVFLIWGAVTITFYVNKYLKLKPTFLRYGSLFFIPCIFLLLAYCVFVKRESGEIAKPTGQVVTDNSLKQPITAEKIGNIQNTIGNGNTTTQIEANSHSENYFGPVYKNNGDVLNYNSPPQRELEGKEFSNIVNSIPSKTTRVRVSMPTNNMEAANYGNQLFERLSDLGFVNLSKATVGESQNYAKGKRISIQKGKGTDPAVTLIINPQ